MSVFRLYNENGSIAFDNHTSTFGLVKAGYLTRIEPTDTPAQKRTVWGKLVNDPSAVSVYLREYRLYYQKNPTAQKDFYDIQLKNVQYRDTNGVQKTGDLPPLRQALSKYNEHTFYANDKKYYIDVVCDASPIVFVHCDRPKPQNSGIAISLDADNSPFIGIAYFYTQKLNATTYRVFYTSAMPLSDEELRKFQIYAFGLTRQKAKGVGLHLYDEQGNLTFSSANMPLKTFVKPLTLSKNKQDKKVFIDKDNWQGNLLGDYTYQVLETNRRYATMNGGITELLDPKRYFEPNEPLIVWGCDAINVSLFYGNDWDWFSSLEFGSVGFIGGITAYIGSGYYQYARLDRRVHAKYIEFEWRNANKTHTDIYVADVTHLPFPFN